MPRPYSIDLRERVLSAELAHLPSRVVAARFGVSHSSVIKWRARQRDTGETGPARMGGTRPVLLLAHRGWLEERIASQPDVTLAVLQAELQEKGVRISQVSISNFLRRIGLSYKKNGIRQRAGQA